MSNIYYDPEKCGLKIVGLADIGEGYDFDILLVVEDESKNLFYAQDSGCSCPIPFEYTTKSDLIPIKNAEEFYKVAFNHRPYVWEESLESKVNFHPASLDIWIKVNSYF